MNRLEEAAQLLQASPADIPGLWNAPGYPELTTNQLFTIAFPQSESLLTNPYPKALDVIIYRGDSNER